MKLDDIESNRFFPSVNRIYLVESIYGCVLLHVWGLHGFVKTLSTLSLLLWLH